MDSEALYIRNPSDSKPRGPLTLKEVADLVSAGEVSVRTLVFDPTKQQWAPIESRPEIVNAVLPARSGLALKRPRESRPGLTAPARGEVDVHDLLAAAEGQTAETAARRHSDDAISRATAVGHYGAIASLLLAAAANLAPAHDAVTSFRASQLLAQPLACLGLLDLALGVALALGVTSIFPLIRFRAAGGLGLAGFIYFAQGRNAELALVTCGCTGLFLSTIVLRTLPAILATTLAIGGMGFLAWFTLVSH